MVKVKQSAEELLGSPAQVGNIFTDRAYHSLKKKSSSSSFWLVTSVLPSALEGEPLKFTHGRAPRTGRVCRDEQYSIETI